MSIKIDASWNSFLVKCTACPYWFALRLDKREAYLAGEAHQVRVHDIEPNIAASPRRLWEAREARHAASA